ncbi:hypothetical protein AA0113_g6729 [Alternaria arborescens]|uniref:Uncharacterized protein n=3 Tax=Alternaria sect. Alternaria TaxID=2499237 RepID=A0A4Q4MVE0_ALTAL|nr:hypothetical protein AA0117_g13018 [Alternaria alternata]RYN87296.1 hypothetical protein AA0119_g12517 [Alternaria tenuissima]RYO04346.1 hypothetical protein AA0121_g12860 [Alternaria tenuissima]RYO61736.1 hypothetical protein AA0113_g6729 [Alternaria arborescens]RYO63062.1 hypothetical protein AA0116_g5182 [Alternaria tenuissima]
MRVLLPVTILALFGSTAVTACQANGSIGYNFDIQTLASIRCCSGCGYNSCTKTLYYCPSASGSTSNLQLSICG